MIHNADADGSEQSIRVGIWQDMPAVPVSRCLAKSGWDFVVLDLQHGPMSFETAYECVQALHASQTQAWVRIGIDSVSDVQRALDIGADAVVVPMVNSVEMARQVAMAAKYPPLGVRSLGGDCSLQQGSAYVDNANANTKLFVQVEHIESIAIVDEIMALDGVDGCFVGPTDLALSMNLCRHEYATDGQHREVMARVLKACKAAGKTACCNCYSLDDAREKVAAGFECITQQSEVTLLLEAGKQLRNDLATLSSPGQEERKVPPPKHPAFVRGEVGSVRPL